MALIKCKGCGNMVSSGAESCPNCGFFVRLSMEQMTIEITSELTESVQKYDELGEFREEMAKVRKGDLWGFVNQNGEEVIPCIYDNAENFSEGLAGVSFAGKWGYVDQNGNSTFTDR